MGTTPNPATAQAATTATPQQTPAANPDRGYSVDELAGQIKAKYPAYNSWDNHYLVSQVIEKHPSYQTWLNIGGLQELNARNNPNTGIAAQPEAARSQNLANMTRAMSGQPMTSPAEQAKFEQGRKAGAISAALTTASGAAGGVLNAVTTPGTVIRTVPSTILDEGGAPILKHVAEETPSMVNQAAKAIANWAKANPKTAGLASLAAADLGINHGRLVHALMKYGLLGVE